MNVETVSNVVSDYMEIADCMEEYDIKEHILSLCDGGSIEDIPNVNPLRPSIETRSQFAVVK